MRTDGRKADQLRPLTFELGYTMHPEGSVFISLGNTKVLCTATVEERLPSFLKGTGKGWVTAEYAMLPRATGERTQRESTKGKQMGRTIEIQRLIGRSLRAVIDLELLGERSILIDCDVIQADGGTRTASITGAFIALTLAIQKLINNGTLPVNPIQEHLAAVSVGILPETGAVLDLNYQEDFAAHVDMNVVMTSSGEFVELQGTGEEATFNFNQLQKLLQLAEKGIEEMIQKQQEVLKEASQ